LSSAMIDGIRPCAENIAVELGVGTGSFTKRLRDVVMDEKSYLGVEIDSKFCRALRREFTGMKFVCGDATKLRDLHKSSGLGKVGYILSGIPFVTLPNEVGDAILEEVSKFMDAGDCTFRTFQYAHGFYMPSALKLRAFMRKRYGRAKKSDLIFKNVPPAYTLTWRT
jgi:phosphatidylethanolamine/phosphatidyl-N-methylethanolamine N-methyltransferase